jgi:hypothetical protein
MRQILTLAKFLVATDESDMSQTGKERVAAQYAAATGIDRGYGVLVRHARMNLRLFPSF